MLITSTIYEVNTKGGKTHTTENGERYLVGEQTMLKLGVVIDGNDL
jgi:hypothetical protein